MPTRPQFAEMQKRSSAQRRRAMSPLDRSERQLVRGSADSLGDPCNGKRVIPTGEALDAVREAVPFLDQVSELERDWDAASCPGPVESEKHEQAIVAEVEYPVELHLKRPLPHAGVPLIEQLAYPLVATKDAVESWNAAADDKLAVQMEVVKDRDDVPSVPRLVRTPEPPEFDPNQSVPGDVDRSPSSRVMISAKVKAAGRSGVRKRLRTGAMCLARP
jgi:hypothetical protein